MMNNYSCEYGLAMFKLAKESGREKEIFDDFSAVRDIFSDNPELQRLLSNPRLTASEREDVLENIFGGKVEPYLLNMLKILAKKRRCDMVDGCWREYRRLYCEANNILPVTASSAVELTQAQKDRLCRTIEQKTGSKVILECRIDPGCIGGVRIEYGNKRFDTSVKQRLSSLKRSLKSDYHPIQKQ